MINRIVNFLIKRNYRTFVCDGCFDIAARNDLLLLIKVLINVDGLDQEQAKSLKAISYFLSAFPFVVSMKNNREFLNERIVYSRFEIPVMTPKAFEEFIEGEIFCLNSAKGRHTIEIDNIKLRKKRKELNLTLEQFSKLIGITKKALYEIEKKRVNPTLKTVEKIEMLVNENIRKPYKLREVSPIHLKARNGFEKTVSEELYRIGFDNTPVYSAPFRIVGKEKFSLIANLLKNMHGIKREVYKFRTLSSMFSSKFIFFAKEFEEKNIEGVPVISEPELFEIESAKEFSKLIQEKTS